MGNPFAKMAELIQSHRFTKVDNLTKGLLYKGEKGTYFAAEKMSVNTMNQSLEEDLRFFRGIESHENIVRCFIYCTFDDQSVLKLTEVGDANLEEYANNRNILPLTQLYSAQQTTSPEEYFHLNSNNLPSELDLLHQTAQGLKYLHDNDIIHRNIQPSNVSLTRNSQNKVVAKLGDFRYSRKSKSNKVSPNQAADSPSQEDKTALLYMASECHEGTWSKESDVFAFGVLNYYTLSTTHRHPFHVGQDEIDVERTKINIISKTEPDVKHKQLASKTWEGKFTQKAMIKQMIDHDPAKRLTINDVLHHPTFYTPQRKLDFLLTVRESLEKHYTDDSFRQRLSDVPKTFNLHKTFKDHRYMITPLSKQPHQEQEHNRNYKGRLETYSPKRFWKLTASPKNIT